MSKIKFENSLKFMRFSLLLCGIKVYRNKWCKIVDIFVDSYLFYLNLLILYTVNLGEVSWLIYGLKTGRSFVELSVQMPLITMCLLGTVKAFFLYINRDLIRKIIDVLEEMHPEEETAIDGGIDATERRIVDESVKMLNTVGLLMRAISGTVLVMFCLTPLGVMLANYMESGRMEVVYAFDARYWFDMYETRCWPLLYLHQLWATGVVCVNIFGCELLYYALCSYVEMHFRLLCHRLENIGLFDSKETKQRLGEAVRKHQQLIQLVDYGEVLFSKSGLFHIVTSSMLICLSAFNITMAKEMSVLFAFVTFLMLTLSQVALVCFFGDKLMTSSAQVGNAVYQCPWHTFDTSSKKAVFIIIMRSRKPCKISASKFADFNLTAFTTILSRSWSYFALLKTMADN